MSAWSPYLVSGLVTGSIISIAALGLALSYKTSGLLNFGHGALAAAGAYAFYDVADVHRVPWPLAAIVSVGLFGVGGGLAMERLSRRLSRLPPVAGVVATIGLLVALRQAAVIRYGASALTVRHFLPTAAFRVGGVFVTAEQVIIAAVGAASAAGLYVFFRVSRLGRAMRAAVDDAELLDVTGVNPVRVRRAAWVVGCSFAAVSGILFAPVVILDSTILTLLVVQAFSGAVLGGFSNLPAVYAGSLVVGVLQAFATKFASARPTLSGLPPSVPFLLLVGVLLVAGPRFKEVASTRIEQLRRPRPVSRPLAASATVTTAAVAVVLPFAVGAKLPVWSGALANATLFLSLALLVRLSGQVSLCQLTFAAVGAATFGHLAGGRGVPWLLALVLAGAAAVPFGAAVAIPAIRLSRLYLALATLGFGILCQELLFRRSFLFGSGGEVLHMPRPHLLGMQTDRGFFLVLLGVFAAAAALVASLERARLGRLLRCLADSPLALRTHGANLSVSLVLVFCISAFLAGVSGALSAQLPGTVTADGFQPFDSLVIVAILAIAGRRTIAASLIAAVAFTVVPAYVNNATFNKYLPLLFGVTALLSASIGGGEVTIGLPSPFRASDARRRSRLRSRGATTATVLVTTP